MGIADGVTAPIDGGAASRSTQASPTIFLLTD